MNISISGQGQPIVLIHGYCESKHIWSSFEQELAKHYQVILVDLPGHGSSPLSNTNFSIDDIADELQDELIEHGVKQYFLIGHSLGGYIALALAELYPENISGFGLFSSSTFADDEDKKKVRDKVKAYIEEHGVSSFMESFVPLLFASNNVDRLEKQITELTKRASLTPPESVIGYAMAMKTRPDRTHILAKTDKPTFIIAGEKDTAVKLDVSKQMISMINHGDSVVLEGVGHNGFLENEKGSLDFILSFLSKYLT